MPPKKKAAAETPKMEKSNSVLRLILSLSTVRNSLDFGINEDCRIIKIDNTERKREGEILRKNTFITIAKYNKNNEIVGQNEFSYFNLDSSSEYVLESFINQLSQMTHLVELLNPEEASAFNPLGKITTDDELSKTLGNQKACTELQTNMYEQFEEILKDHIGENCPLLAVKIVTEKTGQYLNLPKEAKFAALMTEDYSFLKVSQYELKMKNAALTPQTVTPDNKGENPAEKSKKSIMKI